MFSSPTSRAGLLSAAAILALVLLPASTQASDKHGDKDKKGAKAPATEITTCDYTITVPGTYVLAADLTCGGNGVTIQASHVRLDLDGHRLYGSGGGVGVLVYSAAERLTDVTLEGPGVVTRFNHGIRLDNVDHGRIRGVTSTRNFNGVMTSTFVDSTVTGLSVRDSVFSANLGFGMLIGNSDDGQIRRNITAGNGTGGAGGLAGIGIIGGSGNLVQENVSTANFGDGISISGGFTYFSVPTGNRVRDNLASGNFQGGIHIWGGDDNAVERNSALGNLDGVDMRDDNVACGSNTWRRNTFVTSNQPCIVPAPAHHDH
ncbi:MAG: right-handed parallel beta-helix repeat-containing protein [Vicinamibacterales bacterium]